jgi:DNA-binding NarL/FixJ family response regulator
MPADQKMAIATPSDELDRRWNAELGLLDAIVSAWTYQQAEVIPDIMTGHTQQEIADRLHIEQSTIHRRLRAADWPAAERYLAYVAEDIKRSLNVLP